MSELNKQLFGVIDKAFCGHAVGSIQKSSDECERICLQAMIDLLNRISENSYDGEIGYTLFTYKTELQEQLKQLNK